MPLYKETKPNLKRNKETFPSQSVYAFNPSLNQAQDMTQGLFLNRIQQRWIKKKNLTS